MTERTPRRGLMLIVCSPSGAGKTSLCRRLMADHAGLVLSLSATTRPARPGEEDGRDYRFVSRETFDAMVAEDAFLEWADVHGHRYGSPRGPVDAALRDGRDVLFDIDWQGARRIREQAPEAVVQVFILPPSLAELKRRLYARAQDAPEVIERRVARAKGEIEQYRDGEYVIVNDDFDRSYADLAHIYHAERTRRDRNPWAERFVDGLINEPV
jgi:guanylate kinase